MINRIERKADYYLRDEDKQAIRSTAHLLAAGHSSAKGIATILEEQMLEVAGHRPSSGGQGYAQWAITFQAFVKILAAIAEQEMRRARMDKLL